MAYELNVQRESVGPCRMCGTEVPTELYERVDSAAGVPLGRSVRRRVSCTCGAWRNERVDRATAARHPRTPGVGARIAMSYVLIVGMTALAAVQAWYFWIGRERGQARAPEVGDRYTIDVEDWPGAVGSGYGLLRVEAVTDETVAIAGCKDTYLVEKDVEENCDAFPIALDPIARSEVPHRLETGLICDIERSGDQVLSTVLIAGILGAVGLMLALHARRTRQAIA